MSRMATIRSWQWPTESSHRSWPSHSYKKFFFSQEVAEELKVDHSKVIQHLKHIHKVKKIDKWVPYEPSAKKKTQNHRFEVSSYSVQHQQTISQSDCDMWRKVDFIQQLKMTSSVVGLRSSKALPKAKLTPKKGHGHCLAVCCPYDPLYLSKTTISEKYAQQIDEMQWKHFYNQQEAENAFQELSES